MTTESDTDCLSCGACCSYSPRWPRFGLEDDAKIARIAPQFINVTRTGMRCDGNRCSALGGTVGLSTACAVYEVRPDVCRDCMPGDDSCRVARARFGLAPLAADRA